MNRPHHASAALAASLFALCLAAPGAWAQAKRPSYRCPGPPVSYTNSITEREAQEKGCRILDATVNTVERVQAPPSAPPMAAASSDSRRKLTEQLTLQQAELANLKAEYNNGEPERQGNEKNYARYQERVASLKAAIAQKEAEIAGTKTQIDKAL